MITKECPLCHETKPMDAFSRQLKGRKDGRHPYCKACVSARNKIAYARRGRDSWLNEKTCNRCQKLKPRSDFRHLGARKWAPRCVACEQEAEQQTAAGKKFCNICRAWLEPGAFHPSKLAMPNTACKACTKDQMTQPNYRLRRRKVQLRKDYGITVEQYFELVDKQGGKCPVCKAAFTPGDLSNPVDHVHSGPQKGRIRAITHQGCNRFVLWTHEDSAQLRAAADLIDNPLTDWYVPGVPSNELRWSKTRKKGTHDD